MDQCAGALLSMVGESERSRPLLQEALEINPRLPGWVHWAAAVNAHQSGDALGAKRATQRFSLPECFWDHLISSTVQLRLGEVEKARISVKQALNLRPRLAEQPETIVSRIMPIRRMQNDFLEALQHQ